MDVELDRSWVPVDWYDDGFPGDDFELLDLDKEGGAEAMDWDGVWGESDESVAKAESGKRWIERELKAGRPGIAAEFEQLWAEGKIR